MSKFTLNPLPYAYEALEPVISKQIMELHHDKHHAAYVAGANAALEKLEKARAGEIEINTREVMRDLSFNANGAMMHDIFWKVMRAPTDNNLPTEKALVVINRDYGSFDAFQKEFSAAASQVEGSGWAVVYNTPGGLMTGQLEKHNLLALNGCLPILALDVWEHAYYLQYLNNRAEYVKQWWQLVNWNEFEKALG
ncbi:superoxide dismutase [Candidatus Shapirobacteria bacterium]|nr:superoxide dismutase [Candidatus Shapirobacteria bacterium]